MSADVFAPASTALRLAPDWRVWSDGSQSTQGYQDLPFPLFADIRSEFLAAAVVDRDFDVTLTPGGGGSRAMENAAEANGDVVDAAREAAEWLSPDDEVLEIRIATKKEVHFVRPLDAEGSMYLYVAFDKDKGKYQDLAHMRMKMIELAFGL